MKQVRETTAGQSISAYVVLDKKGRHVATVQSHYSNGGTVTVDVWSDGDAAMAANWTTARKIGRVTDKQAAELVSMAPDYYTTPESRESWAAHHRFGLQQGRAGSYGYDKFTAALAGLIIDGHTMADHCGSVPEAEKARASLLHQYKKACDAGGNGDDKVWRDKAARIGCSFANWGSCGVGDRYMSLHFIDGLHRLECLGYRVIQAI